MFWRGLGSRYFGSLKCRIEGSWLSPCGFPPKIINVSDKQESEEFFNRVPLFSIYGALMIKYYW